MLNTKRYHNITTGELNFIDLIVLGARSKVTDDIYYTDLYGYLRVCTTKEKETIIDNSLKFYNKLKNE